MSDLSMTAFRTGLPIEVKELDETGEFEGYGAVFGNMDQGRDICVAGCFAKSLVERPKVKLLWQHDPANLLGKFLDVREDAKGLYCRGKLNLKTRLGGEVYEHMKEGEIDGLSVGYRTVTAEWDKELEVRRLTEVKLYEVSVVTFPMNESALVSRVKQLADPRELENAFQLAGLSRSDSQKAVSAVKSWLALGDPDLADTAAHRDEGPALEKLLETIRSVRGG
jgi:HK97 family phage prohead protease